MHPVLNTTFNCLNVFISVALFANHLNHLSFIFSKQSSITVSVHLFAGECPKVPQVKDRTKNDDTRKEPRNVSNTHPSYQDLRLDTN